MLIHCKPLIPGKNGLNHLWLDLSQLLLVLLILLFHQFHLHLLSSLLERITQNLMPDFHIPIVFVKPCLHSHNSDNMVFYFGFQAKFGAYVSQEILYEEKCVV